MVALNVASSVLETSDVAVVAVRVDPIQFLATWICLLLSSLLPPPPSFISSPLPLPLPLPQPQPQPQPQQQ